MKIYKTMLHEDQIDLCCLWIETEKLPPVFQIDIFPKDVFFHYKKEDDYGFTVDGKKIIDVYPLDRPWNTDPDGPPNRSSFAPRLCGYKIISIIRNIPALPLPHDNQRKVEHIGKDTHVSLLDVDITIVPVIQEGKQ